MRFFSKNTQTLIGSSISNIGSIITRRRPEKQEEGFRLQVIGYSSISVVLFFLFTVPCSLSPIYAITDPLAVPNNKLGIHIITPSPDEASPAAQMVNNNGDWGYVTVLIQKNDQKVDKWQTFFNDLRRRHLIPIVRLATEPEKDYWKIPDKNDAQNWADFLDQLIWPTQNRYVVIYNEPNSAQEWGNKVDPKGYAQVLDQTITALKNKSPDFFILNAGLDASAPQKAPKYEEELSYLKDVNAAVPGIFNKLDGWASHSYPNPGFAGSPDATGRGTVRTWQWELDQLKKFGIDKNLPVFITETGWKHAEGISYNSALPNEDMLSKYYTTAFNNAWNDNRIVAVTPFLLDYQEAPFDHFSFKRLTGEKQKQKLFSGVGQVLAAEYPPFYAFYQTLKDLPKTKGEPVQQTSARLTRGEVYSSVVGGEQYDISLTFRNTGQSIWYGTDQLRVVATKGGQELSIDPVDIPSGATVEPGQDYTFHLKLTAPLKGTFAVSINLFKDGSEFKSPPAEFTTTIKSPVILQIKTSLQWKNDPAGDYELSINGVTGNKQQAVLIDKSGAAADLIAKYLLPDYEFKFTLTKPNYLSKTITQKVISGENVVDFGALQPDLLSNLLHFGILWKLLPFSKP